MSIDDYVESGTPLPFACYSETEDGHVVIIFYGEDGYFMGDKKKLQGKTARQLNEENGVSVAEANALRAGSMYGWDSPMARASYWEEKEDDQTESD